jgi:aromatic ring hydroxylase
MLCDIAGGVVATFPHEKDFLNPETRDLLLKYTKRNPNMPVEDQAQFWRYLGDVLCSASGGISNIGNYHGGGSPVMEQIAITTQYDIEVQEEAREAPRRHERRRPRRSEQGHDAAERASQPASRRHLPEISLRPVN